MKYAKGVSWTDDTRIPHNEEIMVATDYKETKQSETSWNIKNRILEPSNRGRFTPSLLVCDDMLNDGNIGKSNERKPSNRRTNGTISLGFLTDCYSGVNDKGTNSRYYDLDKWFDKVINNL
jgi:hypothetical protein